MLYNQRPLPLHRFFHLTHLRPHRSAPQMPREARSAPGAQLPINGYESLLSGRGDPRLCRGRARGGGELLGFSAGVWWSRLPVLSGFSATGNFTSGTWRLDWGLYPLSSTGKASHVSPGPVCLSCSCWGKTSNARPLGIVISLLSLVMSSRNRIFMGCHPASVPLLGLSLPSVISRLI
jgi:hypothetical protein